MQAIKITLETVVAGTMTLHVSDAMCNRILEEKKSGFISPDLKEFINANMGRFAEDHRTYRLLGTEFSRVGGEIDFSDKPMTTYAK